MGQGSWGTSACSSSSSPLLTTAEGLGRVTGALLHQRRGSRAAANDQHMWAGNSCVRWMAGQSRVMVVAAHRLVVAGAGLVGGGAVAKAVVVGAVGWGGGGGAMG